MQYYNTNAILNRFHSTLRQRCEYVFTSTRVIRPRSRNDEKLTLIVLVVVFATYPQTYDKYMSKRLLLSKIKKYLWQSLPPSYYTDLPSLQAVIFSLLRSRVKIVERRHNLKTYWLLLEITAKIIKEILVFIYLNNK